MQTVMFGTTCMLHSRPAAWPFQKHQVPWRALLLWLQEGREHHPRQYSSPQPPWPAVALPQRPEPLGVTGDLWPAGAWCAEFSTKYRRDSIKCMHSGTQGGPGLPRGPHPARDTEPKSETMAWGGRGRGMCNCTCA